MNKIILTVFLLITFNLFAKVQIIPVVPSPSPENAKVYIAYPEKGQTYSSNDIWIQVKLRGYPLGMRTDNDRSREIANSSLGQSLHVVIDNNIYFARTGPVLDPYDEDANYYESIYRFKVPSKLSQGKHYLRIFPATSYGESLKNEDSFASTYFFVENTRATQKVDLSEPFITFNEPSGYMKLNEKQPVLLDFYVSNCVLSSDGYKVKVTIDRNITRYISLWIPYYIYGLKKGKHTIRLQLIDKKGKPVSGSFNDITRHFYIN